MKFGIDAISFYTTNYYIDLKTLTKARGFINQVDLKETQPACSQMAIIPPGEDIITLATSAAWKVLKTEDLSSIEMVLFATESGIDYSKAAASYIHQFFELPRRCRVIELKQACYSATFGLQLGISWLRSNPTKKILLIASDIARYQSGTIAECSQGCGAVAMLLSANPRILEVETVSGFCTKERMDFWRPHYLPFAMVNGRLSCETYLSLLKNSWQQYIDLTGRNFSDHARFSYHIPIIKLVATAHKKLAKLNGIRLAPEQLNQQIAASLTYSRKIGNCYTASLYLSIISLLENDPANLADSLVGLYSYGSGSIGEFFAARVIPGYDLWLDKNYHQQLLDQRQELTMDEYEKFYEFTVDPRSKNFTMPTFQVGKLRLKALVNHQRVYEKVAWS